MTVGDATRLAVQYGEVRARVRHLQQLAEQLPRSDRMGGWEGRTQCPLSSAPEEAINGLAVELASRAGGLEGLMAGYSQVLWAAADDLAMIDQDGADAFRQLLWQIENQDGEGS